MLHMHTSVHTYAAFQFEACTDTSRVRNTATMHLHVCIPFTFVYKRIYACIYTYGPSRRHHKVWEHSTTATYFHYSVCVCVCVCVRVCVCFFVYRHTYMHRFVERWNSGALLFLKESTQLRVFPKPWWTIGLVVSHVMELCVRMCSLMELCVRMCSLWCISCMYVCMYVYIYIYIYRERERERERELINLCR